MSLWDRHHGVRSGEQLTFGERAADTMRSSMGSWTFVFAFIGFMAAWAVLNVAILRSRGFDPYPFILLNLLLSTMAGLQAAALLIAAKRADAVSAEVALHTEKTADQIKELLEQNTTLTTEVHRLANAQGPALLAVMRAVAAADPKVADLIPREWTSGGNSQLAGG
jgi:uncharacterized membrane protein